MIQTQKKYSDYLQEVKNILKDTNVEISKINFYEEKINNTELIVPVVGGFSAGKSTLINQFLGENILSTALTPETALATELRYSENSYIKAIKKDDTFDKYEILEIDIIKEKAKNYKYIKLYLNNQKLQEIEPLILVDMPGFDAPIEHHNQAILNYLNRGIYFIILTSIEDGNITKSVLREITNIMEFGKDFSFCLSKTNLRTENDIKAVQNIIEDQLKDYFDFNKEIILTDNSSGLELEKILNKIDIEELFKKVFLYDLRFNHIENESSINIILSTLKVSREEVLKTIAELENSIKNILNKKEQMIEEAEEKYSNTNIDGIINKITNELNLQKEVLISYAIANPNNISQEINEIVKNILIPEIRKRIKDVSNRIVDDFSIELKNLENNLDNSNFDNNWIEKISYSTKNILEKAQNGLSTIVDERRSKETDDKLYKAITTILGVTTSFVAPIIEIIIIFLPEIVRFISGKAKEKQQKEKISEQISISIIPEIKRKLRETIPQIFNDYLKNTIETISQEFETQLERKRQEIIVTQQDKEDNIKDIEQEILKLENIKKELQFLATKNLYNQGK
ncbi:dynamin family protein [Aliarcobacter cryaerophilus]|uniref:dynamin family protein n=2 Tax=Aliarcobacter cryaerophilus TaxID=28198 RepID=UPI0011DFF59D|nr:dynamin family protein [Aliarcobacter cryaerophilus]